MMSPDQISEQSRSILLTANTIIPAEIVSYNAETQRATVQPIYFTMLQGESISQIMPQVIDAPVVFPGAGDFWLTFPLSEGDGVLLAVAQRSIDVWLTQGKVADQQSFRVMDLSDGFVIPGINPDPKVLTSVASDGMQLRNRSGLITLTLKNNEIVIESPVTISGDVSIAGNLDVTGDITGITVATVAGIDLGTHVHTVVAVASPGAVTITSAGPIPAP